MTGVKAYSVSQNRIRVRLDVRKLGLERGDTASRRSEVDHEMGEGQESPLSVTSTGLAQDLISCISTRSLELGNPELTAWRPFDFNHEYKVWKVLKLSVTHSERKIQIEFM
jgi:hypothetical protein